MKWYFMGWYRKIILKKKDNYKYNIQNLIIILDYKLIMKYIIYFKIIFDY